MRPIVVSQTGTGSSALVRFDDWAGDDITVQAVVSGTVNYTIQTSMDDPNSPWNPVALASMTWTAASVATGATATLGPTPLGQHPLFARVTVNSGTGTVTCTFLQGEVVPY